MCPYRRNFYDHLADVNLFARKRLAVQVTVPDVQRCSGNEQLNMHRRCVSENESPPALQLGAMNLRQISGSDSR